MLGNERPVSDAGPNLTGETSFPGPVSRPAARPGFRKSPPLRAPPTTDIFGEHTVRLMTDANGEHLIHGFDIENHRQTVTNRRGLETVYDYDGRGNVTKKTDPLGNVEESTFDDRDNNLSKKLTDANGNSLSHKTFEYDENDNQFSNACMSRAKTGR